MLPPSNTVLHLCSVHLMTSIVIWVSVMDLVVSGFSGQGISTVKEYPWESV